MIGIFILVAISKFHGKGMQEQYWELMTIGDHSIQYSFEDDAVNAQSPIFYIKVHSLKDGHVECDMRGGVHSVDDLCGANWRSVHGQVLHVWPVPGGTAEFKFKDSTGKLQFAEIIKFPKYRESDLAIWYGNEPMAAVPPKILTDLPMVW